MEVAGEKEIGAKLRRGAWTAEEDDLLRNCIAKYGEGKWNLIPIRSGLNRCRKSCRLRWLNYLKPSIKKGPFEEDEVDLIIRLHKLLGNRWSLIAGRIPGRTANDIKNYCNSQLHKKKKITKKATPETDHPDAQPKVTVIKPRPRTLISKNLQQRPKSSTDNQNILSVEINNTTTNPEPLPNCEVPENLENTYGNIQWWPDDEYMFFDNINEVTAGEGCLKEDGQSDDLGDLFIDMDIWNLLNS